jgi:hypothetical protein
MILQRLKLMIIAMIMAFTLNTAIASPQSCNLHNHTQRLQKLKSSFSMHLISVNEINKGYVFYFPNNIQVRQFLTEYIKKETECCSFLKLTLLESPTNFTLSIEGNTQAKKLIKVNLAGLISTK